MATRGRRPKPTEMHKLHGTLNVTRHVRDRAGEPVADGDLLALPPEGLTELQAASWSYAVTHAPKGVLRRIDRGVLMVWVAAEDRHWRALQAQARLDAREPEMPFLVFNKKRGEMLISPYLAVMQNAAATMLRAAAELGFSPAARPRLAIDNPTGKASTDDSPWKQLRVMQGGKA